MLHRLLRRLSGIKVYALVGKSGTGKSFRARLLMEKHHIELLIDDGLLIKEQKILAGKSAKRESAYLSAVKTALFNDKNHRALVKSRLEKEKFKSILIIGTSERMIKKIAENLSLPSPAKTIMIEDVATSEEIETAIHYRNTQGMHVIPVPSIEVQKNYPRIMANSVKVFFKKQFGLIQRSRVFEKTVVRPEFSQGKGAVTISEGALTQMILHCVEEEAPMLKVVKVTVKQENRGYRLTVSLNVPFGLQLAGIIHNLHRYIIESVEKYTGIIIEELNLNIDKVTHLAE